MASARRDGDHPGEAELKCWPSARSLTSQPISPKRAAFIRPLLLKADRDPLWYKPIPEVTIRQRVAPAGGFGVCLGETHISSACPMGKGQKNV